MTFPSTVTPKISSSEVFAPNIAGALNTMAAQVIADLNTLAGVTPEATLAPFTCRACCLTIAAYTGSGTGVLTESVNGTLASSISADGVTIAVGDVLFFQAGLTNLTAKDSGPWTVTSLGAAGAKWVLTRPAWWAHGAKWTSGQVIQMGGEGQIYQNTEWKATAASGVIDTTDSAFYVGRLTFQIKLVAGTEALAAAQPSAFAQYPLTGSTAGQHSMPAGILSTTLSSLYAELATSSGTLTGTVGYQPSIAGTNPTLAGYVGTAATQFWAVVSAMTIQNADTSTLQATLINW